MFRVLSCMLSARSLTHDLNALLRRTALSRADDVFVKQKEADDNGLSGGHGHDKLIVNLHEEQQPLETLGRLMRSGEGISVGAEYMRVRDT